MRVLERLTRREFQDRDQGALADFRDELMAVQAADAERTSRMKLWREEAEKHRTVDERKLRGDYGHGAGRGFQQREKHDLRMPYAIAETIKHTYRSAGRMPDIVVARQGSSRREVHRQGACERMLYHSWNQSGARAQISDGAWDGSLLGSAAFEVYFDIQKGCPVFRSFDPATAHVIPGAFDVHDYRRIYRQWVAPVASVQAEYRGQPANWDDIGHGPVEVNAIVGETELSVGGTDLCIVNQMQDPARCVRWTGDVVLYQKDHDYGFTPAQIIPNVGPWRRVWGVSDYELVRNIALYYEKLLSREADILAFIANPLFWHKKTGVPSEQLQRLMRSGGFVGIKEDGDVGAIAPPEAPGFAADHRASVQQALMDVGFSPPASWGHNGQQASGSERTMMMQPQAELAQLKQINFGLGLERINEMLLRLWERKHVGTRRYSGTYAKGGGGTRAYAMILGEDAPTDFAGEFDPVTGQPVDPLPKTPAAIIQGDYANSVLFATHLDVNDPQFVLAEVNKFSQGLQSAQTTLERLGFQSPEDELKLIENESDRFPWMRAGMIALLKMQLEQQNGAAGSTSSGAMPPSDAPEASATAAMEGLFSATNATGALGVDALSTALNGNTDVGRPEGAVAGVPTGAA